ncbi:MAG: hypothetical protein LBR74_00795 [Eubacterium sp.]|nr:hypothetical protein [Eubacterium sp.]
MIAEIHGKIRGTGSNLTERLEDELTGNFFGNMRYLPFNKGLKRILTACIYPSSLSSLFDNLDKMEWAENISFWPKEKEAEIDVLLTFDNIVAGIEVKYQSGLSSDDSVNNSEALPDDEEESRQQLARESRLVKRLAGTGDKLLLLLADESSAHSIYAETVRRQLLSDIRFGYITWQKILIELQSMTVDTPFEAVIIGDLTKLLVRKGFERFNGFTPDIPYIDSSLWWAFDYKADVTFGFAVDKKICGGMHYEFGY